MRHQVLWVHTASDFDLTTICLLLVEKPVG